MKHSLKAILSLSLALICLLTALPLSALGEEAAECPFSLFVYDLPKGIKKPNEQAGSVHEEHYTTYVYDEAGNPGEAVEATVYVYTPYGYDPARQYDAFYLMHGGGEQVGFWFGAGDYAKGGPLYNKAQATTAVNLIDNRIAAGECVEMIVVTPTFAVNGAENFKYELRNDLIPAVEARYSTFAGGDVSPESLRASRDHRAFAGFSMGSMTTIFSAWDGCFDYFAYIGNLSGMDPYDVGIVESILAKMGEGGVYEGLKMKYWYNGNGTEDTAEPDHLRNYAKMLELGGNIWQEGEHYEQGDNCVMVDKPGKKHNHANWMVDLYNMLSVFFKAN